MNLKKIKNFNFFQIHNIHVISTYINVFSHKYLVIVWLFDGSYFEAFHSFTISYFLKI